MPREVLDLREERKRVWAEAWALTENWGLGNNGARVLFDNLMREMGELDRKIQAGIVYKEALSRVLRPSDSVYLQATTSALSSGRPFNSAVLTGATTAQMRKSLIPVADSYTEARNLWVETGDLDYLELMKEYVRDE